mmetsp:Transcript_75008/g.195409  ORF Transcript_75008/g.195409 Transcript_75008/m.195409 type:complete len:208 (-) Transcript_75008:136-759(-)
MYTKLWLIWLLWWQRSQLHFRGLFGYHFLPAGIIICSNGTSYSRSRSIDSASRRLRRLHSRSSSTRLRNSSSSSSNATWAAVAEEDEEEAEEWRGRRSGPQRRRRRSGWRTVAGTHAARAPMSAPGTAARGKVGPGSPASGRRRPRRRHGGSRRGMWTRTTSSGPIRLAGQVASPPAAAAAAPPAVLAGGGTQPTAGATTSCARCWR